MTNEDCKTCEGKGYYIIPNYQHEVLERIQCEACLYEEEFKYRLAESLSMVLNNASPQKLAWIVAELIITGHEKHDSSKDYNKLEMIIQTKNAKEALVLGDIYSKL